MKPWGIIILSLGLLAGCQTGQNPAPAEDLPRPVDLGQGTEGKIDPSQVFFDSRDPGCKTPVGAVKAGTPITWRFFSKDGALTALDLVLMTKLVEGNNDGVSYSDEIIQTLKSAPAPDRPGWVVWEASHTFADRGIYSYHFVMTTAQGDKLHYGNNSELVEIPYVEVRGTGGVGGITGEDEVAPYSQTVYQFDQTLPAGTSRGVIYYIFPERFKNGDPSNDPAPGQTVFYDQKPVEKHTPWADPKPWVPGNADGHKGDDAEYNNDFYGGDLEGIIQKLDYLKDLGVTLIYMTPIFQAPSSHKYDTGDYKKIDPGFGNLDTFQRLVAEGKKRGIGLILDASLNHSGSDSVYMDRFGKYPGIGAFEKGQIRTDSPYADWYTFTGNPDPDKAYKQWANPTLATLKETDSWKKFAFQDPDSVTQFWLGQGIAGWRMDVTPWKSDLFWMQWRQALKKAYPQALTFSEVWFDASKYLTGDTFDSTMNYIFRSAALALGQGKDARHIRHTLEMLQENYPRDVFYRTMNLTSTHDVPRTLYELGYKDVRQKDFAAYRPSYLQIAALQFTFPGLPTIYYGDEIGITGGPDPYCRGPFPWKEDAGDYGDWSLLEDYKKLSGLRQKYPGLLADGDLKFLPGSDKILAYQRGASTGPHALVVFNLGTTDQTWTAPSPGPWQDLWQGQTIKGPRIPLAPKTFRILIQP